MVATLKEERWCQERRDRDIIAEKGSSTTVIVCWEIVVQTTQREGRKEKSEKVGIRKCHHATPLGIVQVKLSEEEKRRVELPNQGSQGIDGDRVTWGEVHRSHGVHLDEENTDGDCV